MRAFINLFVFLAIFFLSACDFGGTDCTLPGTDCKVVVEDNSGTAPEDSGSDTAIDDTGTPPDDSGNNSGDDTADSDSGNNTDIATAQACWDAVPFQIQNLTVNRDDAEYVAGDWSSLQWLDYDPVYELEAVSDNELVTVYSPSGCGNAGAIQGTVYLPAGFAMRSEDDELYNNGIVVAFQPDGTVVEINYLVACGDGSYSGWVMPDNGFQDACASGYSSTEWLGAHGGSHTSATQAIRLGELVSDSAIGRPLPIEVDHTHLSCPSTATSGFDCFVGPLAASGDAYSMDEYVGAIPELTMGSVLVLPEDFDCSGLNTRPGQRLCEVAQDHFFFIVDDSYGEDEVAFPMEEGVAEEVSTSEGITLHNASGDFKSDVEAVMAAILVVANPDVAVQ